MVAYVIDARGIIFNWRMNRIRFTGERGEFYGVRSDRVPILPQGGSPNVNKMKHGFVGVNDLCLPIR